MPTPFPLSEALAFLKGAVPEEPNTFLVLGSGLSGIAKEVAGGVSIPFQDIPGFPKAAVAGHAGQFVSGRIGGRRVLVQAGRFHFYEGHDPSVVVAPVRLASALGAQTLLVTNAAGGIASGLNPGTILLLTDHLNLMGRNPLGGPVEGGELRFPDMSAPYDPALQLLAEEVAVEMGIPLPRGVYCAVLGPCYETPAEVRFLRTLGADAVGMSTVPEVITARARGMRVLGFSLITNKAAGLGSTVLDHQEVLEIGQAAGDKLQKLVSTILARLPVLEVKAS